MLTVGCYLFSHFYNQLSWFHLASMVFAYPRHSKLQNILYIITPLISQHMKNGIFFFWFWPNVSDETQDSLLRQITKTYSRVKIGRPVDSDQKEHEARAHVVHKSAFESCPAHPMLVLIFFFFHQTRPEFSLNMKCFIDFDQKVDVFPMNMRYLASSDQVFSCFQAVLTIATQNLMDSHETRCLSDFPTTNQILSPQKLLSRPYKSDTFLLEMRSSASWPKIRQILMNHEISSHYL